MARSARKRAAQRERSAPPFSKRSCIVAATCGFLLLIAFFNLMGSRSTTHETTNTLHRIFTDPADVPDSVLRKLDVVFVLGGGAPASLDHPPPYVQRRCDDAAALVERRHSLPVLCLSAGTAHVPQLLTPNGTPVWESTASAAYLKAHHPHVEHIYVETTSYDTIGNAFFARTGHSDIAGWKTLMIVTNKVRM